MTMIEPDKKVIRRALPMKIVHNSTPRFSFEGGEYFTGGPDETAYAFGMPNWVYDRRDSRPLKLTIVAGEELMSASKIHAAFNDDTIERFNLLKQPKPGRLRNNMMMLLILLAFLMAAGAAFYSYYYGINVNCAVHSRACPSP